MIVLGIETSCDDTSAAVYDGHSLRSNVISTQLVHRNFGGVVPELASRAHTQMILPVIRQALEEAHITQNDLDGIAVTYGPGLAGSLLVGLSVAKGMALSLDIPIVGVNHLEGHIWGNKLADPDLKPPFVVLVVSGGHTQIVFVESWGNYIILGKTRDDAAGEAFDKVGKLLDVGYPGGPVIEKLAHEGSTDYIQFPRSFMEDGNYDFSFSGLKTSVLNHVQQIGSDETQKNLSNIAVCFQQAVIDVLVSKTVHAARAMQVSTICLAGGVSANKTMQNHFKEACAPLDIHVICPPPALCTDNGGMIACAGHAFLESGKRSPLSLSPEPALNLV